MYNNSSGKWSNSAQIGIILLDFYPLCLLPHVLLYMGLSLSNSAQLGKANVVTPSKGFRNLAGENNCFLNVTIQALWHLGSFRSGLHSIIRKRRHKLLTSVASGKSVQVDTVVDALCDAFEQYEFTSMDVLPPGQLRQALSEVSEKFPLGDIADANEALDLILQRLHMETSSHGNEDSISCSGVSSCYPERCLSHTIFGGVAVKQVICDKCGASSEPALCTEYLHTFYAAELASKYANLKGTSSISTVAKSKSNSKSKNIRKIGSNKGDYSFGMLLYLCSEYYDKSCPGNGEKYTVPVDAATSSSESSDIAASPITEAVLMEEALPFEGDAGYDDAAMRKMKLMSMGVAEIDRQFVHEGSSSNSSSLLHSKCSGIGKTVTNILEAPYVLALSICWQADTVQLKELQDFFVVIEKEIKLSHMFNINFEPQALPTNSTPIKRKSIFSAFSSMILGGSTTGRSRKVKSPGAPSAINPSEATYVFRGFLAYYGKHYVAFFRSSLEHMVSKVSANSDLGEDRGPPDEYALFDDATVRSIGDWDAVKAECFKAKYQPVLLVYELSTFADTLPYSTDVLYGKIPRRNSTAPSFRELATLSTSHAPVAAMSDKQVRSGEKNLGDSTPTSAAIMQQEVSLILGQPIELHKATGELKESGDELKEKVYINDSLEQARSLEAQSQAYHYYSELKKDADAKWAVSTPSEFRVGLVEKGEVLGKSKIRDMIAANVDVADVKGTGNEMEATIAEDSLMMCNDDGDVPTVSVVFRQPQVYEVTLRPEVVPGRLKPGQVKPVDKAMLGMVFLDAAVESVVELPDASCLPDSKKGNNNRPSNIIVSDFIRNPSNNNPLPCEAEGSVCLMDRVIKCNGVDVSRAPMNAKKLCSVIAEAPFGQDLHFVLQSGYKMCIVCACPLCAHVNEVLPVIQDELRKKADDQPVLIRCQSCGKYMKLNNHVVEESL